MLVRLSILIFFMGLRGFSQKDSTLYLDSNSLSGLFDNQVVYSVVDSLPQYPGGLAAFVRYFHKDISYPSATSDVISSSIKISFIVDTLGAIQNVFVSKNSMGPDFEKQIKDVLKRSTNWKPAISNNKKVCSRLTFPIRIHYR
ncbi:hypothetical protein CNR22_11470 [Sphingobacteriaceae bacterium]|nr:hypothetical protein CNR22_11470 [Sphingobacteriaceae bacterium]